MSSGTKTLENMKEARWYNHWLLSKFERYLKGDILEVGCGIGSFTPLLSKSCNVWAIDINKDYLDKNINPRIGFGDIEKGKYFFRYKKFDCVVCLNVLEHIRNDQRALANIFTLLKVNGFLILLVPAHPWLYGSIDQSIGHFRRYNKKDLLNLLKGVGFDTLLIKPLNWLGALGWKIANLRSSKDVLLRDIKLFNVLAPLFLTTEEVFPLPFGISILAIGKKIK